jgi:hypothetical protein
VLESATALLRAGAPSVHNTPELVLRSYRQPYPERHITCIIHIHRTNSCKPCSLCLQGFFKCLTQHPAAQRLAGWLAHKTMQQPCQQHKSCSPETAATTQPPKLDMH